MCHKSLFILCEPLVPLGTMHVWMETLQWLLRSRLNESEFFIVNFGHNIRKFFYSLNTFSVKFYAYFSVKYLLAFWIVLGKVDLLCWVIFPLKLIIKQDSKKWKKNLETLLFCGLPGIHLAFILLQRLCRVIIYILKFPEASKHDSFNSVKAGQLISKCFPDIKGNDTAVNSVFCYY